ncbi:MAG: 3'(2'),5'-bisphosphate nucleotidase CysQ [Pseudomonadales bacterium]
MSYSNREIIALAKRAGAAILEIYETAFEVETKSDDSPLTAADLAAHKVIVEGLKKLTPGIPVLSEESDQEQLAKRFSWSRYWLIDPLDGTREFVKRNGEFTVNIALIDNHKPVFGLVYSPVLGQCYWGGAQGAFKACGSEAATQISVTSPPQGDRKWRVVGSRSHQTPPFKAFIDALPQRELVAMGSSLKLCLVAEGVADLYPRFGPTCEWDTAAAQAIVEAAGGSVLDMATLKPLRYNTRPETLRNPEFIVCSSVSQTWSPLLSPRS